MDGLMRSMREHLECPVCVGVPRGNVFQCNNGHILCQECHEKVEACPTCRDLLSVPGVRNLIAERLIQSGNFSFPCRHAGDGCRFEAARDKLGAHERSCPARSVPCPDGSTPACGREGGMVPLNQFLRHCEEKHSLNRSVSTAADGSFTQSWPVYDAAMGSKFQNWFISTCMRASFDGNVFVSRMLKKDQVFYMWLVILGGTNDAKKYRAKITCGDGGGGNVTTQSGKVFSIDTGRDKVIKDPECCQLTERQVSQFRMAGGVGKWFLHTTFQITKVTAATTAAVQPRSLMATPCVQPSTPRARDKSKTRPQAKMSAATGKGKNHKF